MKKIAVVLLILFSAVTLSAEKKTTIVYSSDGNAIKLLPTGEEFYQELFAAIDSSKKFICAEYYTVANDSIGNTFLGHLARKAAEGVKVYLMIDGYGSFAYKGKPMKKEVVKQWEASGLAIDIFNQPWFILPLPSNHRKLTVIDGKTSFIGGMNINDKYVKGTPELGEVKDLTVRIDGPAAELFVKIFNKDWNYSADRRDLETAIENPPQPLEDGVDLDILPTTGLFSNPNVCTYYVNIINSAKKSIRIVNGYFMPSVPIVTALHRAAERDVKIDILMGETTDLPDILRQSPFVLADKLDKLDNITLHIYKGGFFHEKAMSVDGESLLVGSANLDMLSRCINREICVFIHDEDIAAQYDKLFDTYATESRKTPKSTQ